jgi:hypothetical protein
MDVLQPAATSEERFLMCRSVLQEGMRWVWLMGVTYYVCVWVSVEPSDEDEELEESSTPDEGRGCGYNFFALSLRIEKGVISMFPEVITS